MSIKCSVVGCVSPVTGGWQNLENANTFQGKLEIPTTKTLWCNEHKASLLSHRRGGRFLSSRELEELR